MNNGILFEGQILKLLQKMGFDAELTKASGDGGIDIIAHKHDDIVGGKFVIQCKDWSNAVGEPAVRDLYGVVMSEKANKGILITNSSFTSQAYQFAKGKNIELIDGERLSELYMKYELLELSEDDFNRCIEIINRFKGLYLKKEKFEDVADRIRELKLQIETNPSNSSFIKELGDLYLRTELYEDSINYYEKLFLISPDNIDEKQRHSYAYGLNNYGVALAGLKQYDKAIALFKTALSYIDESDFGSLVSNQIDLYHYLGLWDLAQKTHNELKSWQIKCNLFDADLNEKIEQPYVMEEYPEEAKLTLFFMDDNGELQIRFKALDTPSSKASEECRIEVFNKMENSFVQIMDAASSIWSLIGNNAQESLGNYTKFKNDCEHVISEYESTLESETENDCIFAMTKKAKLELRMLERTVDLVKMLITRLSGEMAYDNDGEAFGEALCQSAKEISNLSEELNILVEKSKIEFEKTVKKWEETIRKERLYWKLKGKEKLIENKGWPYLS